MKLDGSSERQSFQRCIQSRLFEPHHQSALSKDAMKWYLIDEVFGFGPEPFVGSFDHCLGGWTEHLADMANHSSYQHGSSLCKTVSPTSAVLR